MKKNSLDIPKIKSQLIENGDIVQIVGLVNGMAVKENCNG